MAAGSRSAEDVLDDHLQQGQSGSLEDDLRRNDAADVVLLCTRGVFRGHDGVPGLQQHLSREAPSAPFTYRGSS